MHSTAYITVFVVLLLITYFKRFS